MVNPLAWVCVIATSCPGVLMDMYNSISMGGDILGGKLPPPVDGTLNIINTGLIYLLFHYSFIYIHIHLFIHYSSLFTSHLHLARSLHVYCSTEFAL